MRPEVMELLSMIENMAARGQKYDHLLARVPAMASRDMDTEAEIRMTRLADEIVEKGFTNPARDGWRRRVAAMAEVRAKIRAATPIRTPAPGENADNPIIRVAHESLPRYGDSPYQVLCPACQVGLLQVHRGGKRMMLQRNDHCVLCGQRVYYTDDKIASERLEDDDDAGAH